jgi:hypothetical protein
MNVHALLTSSSVESEWPFLQAVLIVRVPYVAEKRVALCIMLLAGFWGFSSVPPALYVPAEHC